MMSDYSSMIPWAKSIPTPSTPPASLAPGSPQAMALALHREEGDGSARSRSHCQWLCHRPLVRANAEAASLTRLSKAPRSSG